MASKNQVELFAATIPFQYANLVLDIGQVFELRGLPNDARLKTRRYMVPYEGKEDDLFTCSDCGSRFVTELQRRGHGDKRHPARPRTPEEEEMLLDKEDRFLTRNNPLNLPTT